MKRLILLLLSAALAGCASVAPPPAPTALFADAGFAPPSEPVSADELFTLSPAMKAYISSPAFTQTLRSRGSRHGLVDALYSKTDLKLEYESTTTRTAAQTYAVRSGNCLSLVIMTAAFAKALGMPVQFQSVTTDEMWSRMGGLYLASNHVNISIGDRIGDVQNGFDTSRHLVVDFLPPADAAKLRSRALEEEDIVSLYLNNRAAEALVQQRVNDAYWWAKAAVSARPGAVQPLNTLGVVYQRHGDMTLAEQTFRAALSREPENVSVLRNLQPVLLALGRPLEAQELEKRIASIEPYPPYYFFDKGMAALKAGDNDEAKDLFEREIKRSPYNDEFRFWLGIAHLRLGELVDAREHIALAVDNSTRKSNRDIYSAKLAYLRSIAQTGARLR
ncbi:MULTISPECIES: tetratricopeptide repeat protein [unclassified Massilia]|uniref:tetratricopeptide repeat protein n=1 Tax=unclassified Massilia TaxID=2609279 RepID=UPI001B81D80F|nr:MULTISPECIES: tetratricopeptide repeat protein [unclassified Massilia]MBQ5942813.1 tetratricopeptide repeat protein [Massilia sp. AB1]MBQ5964251.1 tetratricopeptide repeat protein [Massilia sp. ZL223]